MLQLAFVLSVRSSPLLNDTTFATRISTFHGEATGLAASDSPQVKMYCLRWWIPLFLLPFPKTSPLFLVLFLFSFALHSHHACTAP